MLALCGQYSGDTPSLMFIYSSEVLYRSAGGDKLICLGCLDKPGLLFRAHLSKLREAGTPTPLLPAEDLEQEARPHGDSGSSSSRKWE